MLDPRPTRRGCLDIRSASGERASGADFHPIADREPGRQDHRRQGRLDSSTWTRSLCVTKYERDDVIAIFVIVLSRLDSAF